MGGRQEDGERDTHTGSRREGHPVGGGFFVFVFVCLRQCRRKLAFFDDGGGEGSRELSLPL